MPHARPGILAMMECADSKRIRKRTRERTRRRPPLNAFKTEHEFLSAVDSYIRYVESNVVEIWRGGERPQEICDAMTVVSFCTFVGITRMTWNKWKNQEPKKGRDWLKPAVMWAESVFEDQRVRGALRGELKENLTARLSGIGDKQVVETDVSLTAKPLDDIFKKLDKRIGEEKELVRKDLAKAEDDA